MVRFTPTGDSGLHSLRCRAAARRPHRFREPTLQQHSSGPVGGASTGAGIGAKVRRHGRGRRALGPCAHLDASTSSSPKCSWILVAAARGRPMRQCARLRWATAAGGGRDAIDHDQLRSWNRCCGRLPAAHGNDRVISAVNDKGRQVESAQVFGSVWCSHGRRQLACDALRIERAVEGTRSSVSSVGYAGEPPVRLKSTARSMAPSGVLTGG